MQKWILIALLSSYSILASAQDKPRIASSRVFFANFETREITVEKIAKPTFGFGVTQVEVIDNRFDTLHLGSINQDKKRDLWLIFANKQPLSQVISNSLLQNEPNPLSLLVVIKDFWFTESKDLNEFGQRKSLTDVNNNLVCKLEFYQKLANNMVVAITRLDTTLTAPNDFATYKSMNRELTGNILQLSVDKIDKAIHASNFTKRKQIPLQDVYSSVKVWGVK